MNQKLGTLEDLPKEYIEDLKEAGVSPLWPMMRNVLPHGKPIAITKSGFWSYEKVRSLLIRAGELTPVEKAERRVLVLSDPGRGQGAMQATSTIYLGMQLLLPGETAPAHRHTPSAARVIIEGKGGYTVVDGEKLPMEEGDLVLTPGGEWHDHGHEGNDPVIWLDALDLPLFVYLEGSYSEESELQKPRNQPDTSQVEYLSSGLVPVVNGKRSNRKYPMMRFPWSKTEQVLKELSKVTDNKIIEVNYVNPENGESVLPTMGFTGTMIKKGNIKISKISSISSAFHILKGSGKSIINGKDFNWGPKDTFTAPVFSEIEHIINEDTFLMHIHDRPLQEKLGYFEERNIS